MTHPKTHMPRRARVPAAALAALLLAGCAGTHVGDEWQCPLPKGGSCGSVAAADPAVPNPAAAGETVLREPLWRPYAERAPGAPTGAGRSCEAGCGGGFDPFAWLARLFGDGNDGSGDPSTAGQPEPATAAKTGSLYAGPDREADVATSSATPGAAEPRLAEPAAAVLPAEQPSLQGEPAAAADEPASDDLRTEEVVARIWIAPFVDADGVYREASYVRVVLEPAGWRVE